MRTYAVLAGDGIGLVLVETLEVEEEERDNFVASTMEEVVLDRLLVGIVNGPLAITKQVSAVGVLLHIHLEAQARRVRFSTLISPQMGPTKRAVRYIGQECSRNVWTLRRLRHRHRHHRNQQHQAIHSPCDVIHSE